MVDEVHDLVVNLGVFSPEALIASLYPLVDFRPFLRANRSGGCIPDPCNPRFSFPSHRRPPHGVPTGFSRRGQRAGGRADVFIYCPPRNEMNHTLVIREVNKKILILL